MRKHIGFVAAGLLAASPAFAGSDPEFVEKAASGGMMEVQLGEYASKNAANPDVRAFGQRMAADHAKANQELKTLARKHGITVPSEMSEEHHEMHDRLMKLKGPEFDRAYMDAMVEDHQDDVEAFREEAKEGQSDVDRWAAKTVPTLEQHLQQARDIHQRLGAATSGPDTTGARTHPSGAMGAEREDPEVRGREDTDRP